MRKCLFTLLLAILCVVAFAIFVSAEGDSGSASMDASDLFN